MAFSLESTLVVPLCLSLVFSSINVAESIDQTCAAAAGLEISAARYRHNPQHLYQITPVVYDGHTSLALETSPARMIHLTRLFQDNLRYLSQGSFSDFAERFNIGEKLKMKRAE